MDTPALARQGIPLRPDRGAVDREWHRSFVRGSAAIILSKVRKDLGSPEQILREQWPNDRTAELVVRAPVTPTKVADYPGGTVAKLMLLAPSSAASQLFASATVVDLRGIASFSFPLPTSFADAAFVGEGQPIPVRQGVFTGMPVGPVRKLALLAALSNELEFASGGIAETIISHTLEVAVGRGLDGVLLSAAAAVVDVSPAGLLNGVTPLAATAGGGVAAMVTDLRGLVGAIAAAGIDTASVVFVAASAQALAISLTAGPHFTHRIIEAGKLAAGTVIAIATAGLAVAGDGALPSVDTSRQGSFHMADPASQIATVGTPPTMAAPVPRLPTWPA